MKIIIGILVVLMAAMALADVNVTLLGPANNTFSKQNVSFQCRAVSNETISTINLLLGSSVNETRMVNSTDETVEFNQTLSDGVYSWNCLAVNMAMEEGTATNFTLTVDNTPPVLSNMTIEPGITNALLNWKTDEPANYTIEYTVHDQNHTVNSSLFETSHGKNLEGFRPDGHYGFIVTSCDVLGNCDNSTLFTFNTQKEPVEPEPAPSSGGGGGGGSFKVKGDDAWKLTKYEGQKFVQVINKLYQNKQHTVNIGNPFFDVREISFKPKKDVSNGGVLVNQLKELPKGSLLAFEIVSNLEKKDVGNITISFRTRKAMMVGKRPNNVFVERDDDGSKEAYPTIQGDETAQYYYFTVAVPGFSLFTVRTEPALVVEDVEVPLEENKTVVLPKEEPPVEEKKVEEKPVEKPPEQPKTEELVPKKSKKGLVWLAVFVTGLVVAGLAYVYWPEEKEEEENEDKKK